MSYISQSCSAALLAFGIWFVASKLKSDPNPLDNLPGPKPKSWIAGSMLDFFGLHAWDFHMDVCQKYGSIFRFATFFSKPALYVMDPKALHYILAKDNESYLGLQSGYIVNNIIFGKGLFATSGDLHRKQRRMLNPVFSVAHMRRMVPTFNEVVGKLRDALKAKAKEGPVEVDLLSWMTRAALELIGQSGLGYSFDPLTENCEQHPYSVAVKSLLGALAKVPFAAHVVLPMVHTWGSLSFQRRVVDFLSLFWGNLRHVRDIKDIMAQTTDEIYEAKKKAFQEGGDAFEHHAGKGNDLITILMRANMAADEIDRLPEDQVKGQITGITFAAMDTTSSALSRVFELLSQNLEFQERLRQEIRDTKAKKGGGDLDYDDMLNMPLLDATCRETMRVFTPILAIVRETVQDTVLPFSKPVIGGDGKEMNEVVVPKGTKVIIGSYTANRNPELWGPDSDEWKPDRWLSQLPDEVVKAKIPGVYSHLLTFIGGPRACIGFKFSELEMKVTLIELLDTFRFTPAVGKKIEWLNSGVAHPAVDGKASLPIQMELV